MIASSAYLLFALHIMSIHIFINYFVGIFHVLKIPKFQYSIGEGLLMNFMRFIICFMINIGL